MPMLAIKAKIYRNTSAHGSPAWSECTCFENVQLNREWDKTDANSRASRVKKSAKTMIALGVTGRIKKKPGDGNYDALMAALYADDVLDLLILDGDREEPGSEGIRGDFQVNAANEDQGLGNVLYVDVTIDPADTDHETVGIQVTGTGSLEEVEFGS